MNQQQQQQQYSARPYSNYYSQAPAQYPNMEPRTIVAPNRPVQWTGQNLPNVLMNNVQSNHHHHQPQQQHYQSSQMLNEQHPQQQQQQNYFNNSYYRSPTTSYYSVTQRPTINCQQPYGTPTGSGTMPAQVRNYPIAASYANNINMNNNSSSSNNNNNTNANANNVNYSNYKRSGPENTQNINYQNQSQFYEQANKSMQYCQEQQPNVMTQHVSNNANMQPSYLVGRIAFDLKPQNFYSQRPNINIEHHQNNRIRVATINSPQMNVNKNSLLIPNNNKPPNVTYLQNFMVNDKINQDSNKTLPKNGQNIHLRQALGLSVLEENIVEKTKPIFKKSTKITNIGSVDYKKIIMSLKSGLLAETTWALDCLNILSSNGSFRIQTIPNILSYLMEYYKCFLNTIFNDLFIDTESDFQLKIMKKRKIDDISSININGKNEFENLIHQGDKIYLLDSTNYTFKTRNGLPVKVKQDDINLSNQLEYSHFENICDYEYLENGNTLSTSYIIQTMEPLWEMIPFIKKTKRDNNDEKNFVSIVDNTKHPQVKPNLKRKLENEAEKFDMDINTTLCPRKESLEVLLKRCLCISSIIRNISFLPENARSMAGYPALLLVLARLLSYYHKHSEKKSFAVVLTELENKTFEKENQEANEIFNGFPFEALHMIRMNSFVTLSNLSEFLDLSNFTDKIILPLLDSLLHWTVCQSSYARDVLPPDNLSCQVQALEIMAKLSIHISNIDLILATPPFDRIENFYKVLVQLIGKEDDPVLRELSLVVLSHFASYDILSVRIIIHQDYSIFNLLGFIEQSEFYNRTHGFYTGRYPHQHDQEPFPITYMLKHAANTLRTLASDCEHNDLHLIKKYENRFVDLIMSIFLDPEVTQILADLVFILSSRKPNVLISYIPQNS